MNWKTVKATFLNALHEPAYRAEIFEQWIDANIYFPGTTEQNVMNHIQKIYLQ